MRPSVCAAVLPAAAPGLSQQIARVLAKRLQATRIRLIAQLGHSAAVH